MANPMIIQKQIKDNTEDLHNFVRDLKLWEDEMKRKDRQLTTDQIDEEVLPPVRRVKLSNKTSPKNVVLEDGKKKRILSSDYKSWDKFDVEKACEDIDNDGVTNVEEDEDFAKQNEKYMKETAMYQKELGNQHVKAAKWDAAIEAYTKAIEAYSKDPIFYANRALCYLKKKKWLQVETDCTEALKLDSTYVKAYLRRAVAREALNRLEDSKHDLSQVLRLEPGNTQAYRDLQRLKEPGLKKKEDSKISVTQQSAGDKSKSLSSKSNTPQLVTKTDKEMLNQAASTSQSKITEEANIEPNWGLCNNTVQPITKLPHLRSKKSLKRIEIHDIGFDKHEHVCVRNLPKQKDVQMNPQSPISTKGSIEPPVHNMCNIGGNQRSIITLAETREIPPVPKTSVQFHQSWSLIKNDSHLCYQFLKQVPGEELADIFKESLESGMFSRILETLASECECDEEGSALLHYLQGLTRVRRFSTLVLFLSSTDISNLKKLFAYCVNRGYSSASEIEQLQRKYEI